MRMSQVLRQLRAEHGSLGRRPRLMDRFDAFLPVTSDTPPLSLGEGFTPLVHARTLGRAMGCPLLYLKVEGQNPTGSFKDRGMVVAVAKALEEGARAIICASTGNTSASAAAYGAAAGLEVVVVLPRGRIAAGKLLQAQAAGARVVAVDGGFDDALTVVRELAAEPDPKRAVTLVNSVNPYRLDGQKTAAFEVIEDLGGAPDYLADPGRQRRQHLGLLDGLLRVPRVGPRRCRARDARDPGRGCRAPRARPAGRRSRRRWRPPSGSDALRAVSWRCAPATSRAARSTRSATRRIRRRLSRPRAL